MADSLTTEYRCGYCYVLCDSMIDPKELPCHHVFCLACLVGDYEENSNAVCRICQHTYQSNTFESLPTPVLSSGKDELSTSEISCDFENCEFQAAISYCLNCQDKICDAHHQAHSAYFGKRHNVISITQYIQSPDKYVKVLCKKHEEKLIKACVKCDKLVCCDCDITRESCAEAQSQHEFKTLERCREEIITLFDWLLKSVNDKIAEMCRRDKAIWSLLSEQEVVCQQIIERIEQFCEEQITTIRNKCEALKARIEKYQRELTNRVEVHNSELMAKKEELQESHGKTVRWLKSSRLVDKIQQRKQMAEQLVSCQHMELKYQPLGIPTIVYEDTLVKRLCLTTIPLSLTLNQSYGTTSRCYSACYGTCGDILVGCRGCLEFFFTDLERVMSSQKFVARFPTIAVKEQEGIYVMSANETPTLYQLELCSPDFVQRKRLFSFNYNNNKVPFFSVSTRYVAVSNVGAKELILFNFKTQKSAVLRPDIPPWVVYFLLDGDLLCTGYEKNVLTKYKLEDGRLKLAWTCQELPGGCGVCTDSSGLIYVCSFNKQAIYIISPIGKLLTTLSLDDLPEKAGQISIRGDELAVPGWDSEVLYTYQIHR